MAKPLNEFGGILRLFYAISWFFLLYYLATFAMGVSIGFIDFEFTEKWSLTNRLAIQALLMINTGVLAYLYYRILKIIKVRSPDTPQRIIKLILFIFGFSLAINIVAIPVYLWADQLEWTQKMTDDLKRDFLQSSGTLAIWYSYFRRSRRVKSYYRDDGVIFYADETDQI